MRRWLVSWVVVLAPVVTAARPMKRELRPAAMAAQTPATAARIEVLGRQAVPNFVTSLNGVGQAATNTGLRAVSCMARAVVVTTEAATKFRASVDVSVQVSASVTVAGAAN